MRIFELDDNAEGIPNTKANDIVKLIKQNCSQYLRNKAKRAMLYRGLHEEDTPGDFFKSRSRTDREPQGMSPNMQALYNAYLKSKGILANRTNSIPTTPNKHHAKRFGKPYLIFPIDGYNWSSQKVKDVGEQGDRGILLNLEPDPKVVEWLMREHNYEWRWQDSINQNLYRLQVQFKVELDFPDVVDKQEVFNRIENAFGPHAGNLAAAMYADTEILISGAFYALNMRSEPAILVCKKLGVSLYTDEDMYLMF